MTTSRLITHQVTSHSECMENTSVLSPNRLNEGVMREVVKSIDLPQNAGDAGDVTPVVSPRATPPPAQHVCYVCRRRLGSAEMLRKHEELSALHEKNLRLQKQANQKRRSDLRNDVIRLRLHPVSPAGETELKQSEIQLGETQEDLEVKWKSSIEKSCTVRVGSYDLEMAGASWTGNKSSNEDRMLLGFSVSENVKGCFVADGHCGEICADYLVDHLVDNIKASLGGGGDDQEYDTCRLESAVLAGFKKTEDDFITYAVAKQIPSGSTLIVSIFFQSGDDVLRSITAHVGDSRGVMQIGETVTRLTEDHKPDREDEKVRLAASGGHVVDVGGIWRVFTPSVVSIGGRTLQWGLAVSRAFGDLALKKPVEIVSAVPEINTVELSDSAVVVIACDGIFDVLSDSETIAAGLDGGPVGILRTAYGKLSDDNLTAIIITVRKAPTTPRSGTPRSGGKQKHSPSRVDEPSTKKQRCESGEKVRKSVTPAKEEVAGKVPLMITPSQQI